MVAVSGRFAASTARSREPAECGDERVRPMIDLASLHRCTVGHMTTAPPGTNDPRIAQGVISATRRARQFFGGGGRESNPPGHSRTLIGFEDRGTHQASGRLRGETYPTRRGLPSCTVGFETLLENGG